MIRISRKCSVLLLMVLLCFHASATVTSNAVDIESNNIYEQLSPIITYFDSGLQNLGADQIEQLDERQWHPVSKISMLAALTANRTLWYRLALNNKTNSNQTVFLSSDNPMLDITDARTKNNSEKSIPHLTNTLEKINHSTRKFTIDANSENILYIKAIGRHSASAAFALHDEKNFIQVTQNNRLISGTINGIILGLIIYNFIIYIKTGQKLHLTYTAIGISNFLTLATHQDIAIHLTENNDMQWLIKGSLFFPVITSISLMEFCRDFFQTQRENTKTDKAIFIYICLLAIIAVSVLCNIPLILLYPPFAIASTVIAIAITKLCISSYNSGNKSTILIAAGLTMPMLSGLVTALVATGRLPAQHHYITLMQISDVIEMLLFSLALAIQVQKMSMAKNERIQEAAAEKIKNNAISHLLSHINHEIRTPLNGIVGASELLQKDASRNSRPIFEMINTTSISLKKMIDEMLDIRSISEGKQTVHEERFELSTLIKECFDLFLPESKRKSVRLFFSIDIKLPTDVTGDHYRIRQIILNLLGNSFKFTENGFISLLVSQDTEDPSCYKFSICDSGSGIRIEDEQKLFMSFEQGEGQNASQNPGTGLGLSIVRNLAYLIGGNCGFIRNSISGSTFWFTAKLITHSNIKRSIHQAFSNMRILIADENQTICENLRIPFEKTAQSVTGISHKVDVDSAIKSNEFDIVLIHKAFLKHCIDEDFLLSIPHVYVYSDSTDQENTENNEIYQSVMRQPCCDDFIRSIARKLVAASAITSKSIKAETEPKNCTILIAEDNKTSQIILKGILNSLEIDCDVCQNGEEAEKLYLQRQSQSNPYSAILMDCEMPVQDGFLTTAAIRKHENDQKIKRTPIIAVTAHTEPSYRLKSHQAGMDNYITKPITINTIKQVLAQFSLTEYDPA